MRIFLLAIAVFMLPSVAAGDGTQEETIENLLHTFLDGASRGDVAVHERFWAEELVDGSLWVLYFKVTLLVYPTI